MSFPTVRLSVQTISHSRTTSVTPSLPRARPIIQTMCHMTHHRPLHHHQPVSRLTRALGEETTATGSHFQFTTPCSTRASQSPSTSTKLFNTRTDTLRLLMAVLAHTVTGTCTASPRVATNGLKSTMLTLCRYIRTPRNHQISRLSSLRTRATRRASGSSSPTATEPVVRSH